MQGPIGRIFVTGDCSIDSVIEKLRWNMHILIICVSQGIRNEFHDHVGRRVGAVSKTKGNAAAQLVSIVFVVLHPWPSRYRCTDLARSRSSRLLSLVVLLGVDDLLLRYKLLVDCNARASPQS